MNPKVYITIPNWNGKADTLECLDSVSRLSYPNKFIVVVDNGSSDDSVSSIRTCHPSVEVIETGENLGYSGACNVGIHFAIKRDADYLLIMNNDTIVDSEMVSHLLNAAEQIGFLSILSPIIYYYYSNKIWYAGAKWNNRLLNFQHIGQGTLDTGQLREIEETAYACGCAMFFHLDVARKVGFFDNDFYLYFEETDWCYRARQYGIKSYLAPHAKMWHKVGSSSGGFASPLQNYYFFRNKLLWGKKHLSKRNLIILYLSLFYDLVIPRLVTNFNQSYPYVKRLYWGILTYGQRIRDLAHFSTHYNAKLLGITDYFQGKLGHSSRSFHIHKEF